MAPGCRAIMFVTEYRHMRIESVGEGVAEDRVQVSCGRADHKPTNYVCDRISWQERGHVVPEVAWSSRSHNCHTRTASVQGGEPKGYSDAVHS